MFRFKELTETRLSFRAVNFVHVVTRRADVSLSVSYVAADVTPTKRWRQFVFSDLLKDFSQRFW